MRVRAFLRATVAAQLVSGALSVAPPWQPAPARAQAALLHITFTAPQGGGVLVHGTYPRVHSHCVHPKQPVLHARFAGSIEVGKASDGSLFVIGVLPFEEYLKGIAEVPRTWPMEALKAQVVAARTYAITHTRYGDPTGRELGYQLCATQSCQVYLGLGVADGPYGDRWQQAVDQTAGQVLLYHGVTADTLYFSTSNGHTLGNDQVFGTAPLPYLRPVVEHDDGASPLAHWQSRLPLSDLARFLRPVGAWGAGPISTVTMSGSNVVLRGPGATRTISGRDFRIDLNGEAPCLDPARYPPANGVNGIPLPQTVPSIWFRISQVAGSALISGRGWGHGVGMVQWGAEGKAARRLSYADILAAYYGGLRPQPYAEPSEIRVGIATGLSSVMIAGAGVEASSPTAGPGPWMVTGGASLTVRRGTAPPSSISPGTLTAPDQARVGKPFGATLSLPQLSVVQVVLRGANGDGDIPLSSSTTEQPGSVSLAAKVPPGTTAGPYTIQAVVTDGIDIVRTPPRQIRVLGGQAASPSPSPAPSGARTPGASPAALASSKGGLGWPLLAVEILAGLAALGVIVVVAIRLRRPDGARNAGSR